MASHRRWAYHVAGVYDGAITRIVYPERLVDETAGGTFDVGAVRT